MTTWNLTLTPPGGPHETREGLSYRETLETLHALMYGTPEAGEDEVPATDGRA